jgi:uncharacterized protein (TIGR03435 family)
VISLGMLTAQFEQPVIDKTGLMGNHDFALKYKGQWDRDRNADDLDPMPPMDRALREELGLKVEAAKGPAPMRSLRPVRDAMAGVLS